MITYRAITKAYSADLDNMAAPMFVNTPGKPPNFKSMFCVMHVVSSTKSNFITFNTQSWKRFTYFANEWKKNICKEREVTLETESKLGLTLEQIKRKESTLAK